MLREPSHPVESTPVALFLHETRESTLFIYVCVCVCGWESTPSPFHQRARTVPFRVPVTAVCVNPSVLFNSTGRRKTPNSTRTKQQIFVFPAVYWASEGFGRSHGDPRDRDRWWRFNLKPCMSRATASSCSFGVIHLVQMTQSHTFLSAPVHFPARLPS